MYNLHILSRFAKISFMHELSVLTNLLLFILLLLHVNERCIFDENKSLHVYYTARCRLT